MDANEFLHSLCEYEKSRPIMAVWRSDEEHVAMEEVTSVSVRPGRVLLHTASHDEHTELWPRACRGNITVGDVTDLVEIEDRSAEVRIIYYAPEHACVGVQPVVALCPFREALLVATQSYVDLAEASDM